MKRILKGKKFYDKSELALVSQIFSLYRKIYLAQEFNPCLKQHRDKLEFILGMVTDTIFSYDDEFLAISPLDKAVKQIITGNFDNPFWRTYITQRFPLNTPTSEEIKNLWKEVKDSAYLYLANKFENQYEFKFNHLELCKQEIIKDNLLQFIELSKHGLVIEDLSKVDFYFVKWIAEFPNKFLWLLDQKLTAFQIINFSDSQRDFIMNEFKQLIEFKNLLSLPLILALEKCLP